MKKILCSLLLASPLLSGLSSTVFAKENHTLTLHLNNEKQKIEGFGASDAWTIDPLIKHWQASGEQAEIEQLADKLFSVDKGIGLSMWRFNIGAGSAEQGDKSAIKLIRGKGYRRAELMQAEPGAPIDESKQTGQIRLLKEAHERGVKEFVAFSNSPPVWATKNKLAHPNNGENIGSTNLKPGMADEFADFLVDVVSYLRGPKVGVPVNYISPINEPGWDWQSKSQEGTPYNIKDAKQVYIQLHKALKQANLEHDIEIDAGEVTEYTAAINDRFYKRFTGNSKGYRAGMQNSGFGQYKNYIDEYLSDPEFANIIGNKISLHGYFSDASSDRLTNLRRLVHKNIKLVNPDASVWMSEFCILGGTGNIRKFSGRGFDPQDMEYALHIARVIHTDLTILNASAWFWWLAVSPYDYKDGLFKIDNSLDSNTLEESKVMWGLGNYSKFIRPGFKRIELSNPDDIKGLMASAYKSADDKKVVIVAVNTNDSATHIKLNMPNADSLPELSDFSVYITDKNNDLSEKPAVKAKQLFEMPAKSIVTFVAEIN